ncbi:MAG: DUF1993 domain-containing protein [Gammaproteobacteria bacterium]|nr:DUF1993 domain-containing protein [Gammaproteobacteria bacterium]
MAISLYDISVASSLQVLSGVSGFLEKGKQHCEENGIDPHDIVTTQLYDDMLPFQFQIVSVAHHSLGSVRGVMAGEFAPPGGPNELDYAGLQELIADAARDLEALDPDEVNSYDGKDVVFKIGGNELPFTAENFVLSFSHPNLYFHAATAYDILRMKGVPLGKRDFMGRMRMNS